MEELERLAELRDKGLITDEEYELQRTNIVPSLKRDIPESKQTAKSLKLSNPASKVTSSGSRDITPNPQNQKQLLNNAIINTQRKLSSKLGNLTESRRPNSNKREESFYKSIGGIPGIIFYLMIIFTIFGGTKACFGEGGGGAPGPYVDPACGTHTYIGC